MDPIAALSEESNQEKPTLLDYYQQVLMAVAEQRKESEAVKETEEAENGPGEEEEENFNRRRGEQDGVILQLTGQTEKTDKLGYSKAGVVGQFEENAQGLDPEEEDLVNRLRQRDQEVRQHELSHAAALGGDAGVIRYTYQIGPDGRAYAIGGSTEVDMGPEATEAATRAKAQKIRAAAMAVGDPSTADASVAGQAVQMERNAGM